jgi:hypothetical protein
MILGCSYSPPCIIPIQTTGVAWTHTCTSSILFNQSWDHPILYGSKMQPNISTCTISSHLPPSWIPWLGATKQARIVTERIKAHTSGTQLQENKYDQSTASSNLLSRWLWEHDVRHCIVALHPASTPQGASYFDADLMTCVHCHFTKSYAFHCWRRKCDGVKLVTHIIHGLKD